MNASNTGAAILAAEFGHAWAICPHSFAALSYAIESYSNRASSGAVLDRTPARRQSTAIIPLTGFLSYRPLSGWLAEMVGGTSTQRFAKAIKEMADSTAVDRIIIDVHSPGGTVSGVEETAAVVAAAARKKPVDSVINTLGASAAYWIASQANRVFISPTGQAGSIGVFALHTDLSEANKKIGVEITYIPSTEAPFKVEAAPIPLSDEARKAAQKEVDSFHTMFASTVARGRRTTVAKVNNDFGRGRLLMAREALAAGLTDRAGTLESVIAEPASSRRSTARASRRRRVLAELEIEAAQ